MKSQLATQEMYLIKSLKGSPDQALLLKRALAAIRYRTGDPESSLELVLEIIHEPWPEKDRFELYRGLLELVMYVDADNRIAAAFAEAKSTETGHDAMAQWFHQLLEICQMDELTDTLRERLMTFIAEREALDSDYRRMFLMFLLEHGRHHLDYGTQAALIEDIRVIDDRVLSVAERVSLFELLTVIPGADVLQDEILEQVETLLPHIVDDELRARLHHIRGMLLHAANKTCEAMRAYESGLRYLDGYSFHLTAALRTKLAAVYDGMGLGRQSIAELRRAIDQPGLRKHDKYMVRRVQFEILVKHGSLAEARTVGQMILSSGIPPAERAPMLYSFCHVMLETGDADTAATLLDKIDRTRLPTTMLSDLFYLSSQINRKRGRDREAVEDMKQSVETASDDRLKLQRRLLLGKLYRETGLIEQGVQTFKAISEAAPEAEEAAAAISAMKELRTDLEDAKLDDVVTRSKRQDILDEIKREVGEKTLFERLRGGLSKTRDSLVAKIEGIISHGEINDDMIDQVEETLILADVGYDTTALIISRLRKAYKEGKLKQAVEIKPFLINEISTILATFEGGIPLKEKPPTVIMMIGVNGVGKTTTIAKLTHKFIEDGKSVIIAAADTFRAGAIEQISEWGRRLDVDVVKHKSGADPSAVVYDAIHAAQARGNDVLIIDTAGRLHTKVNLMEELKKVRRIVNRECDGAPHETLLVLDATNGQNAISQAKIFKQDLDVTGIILTKLDGTAKGGIIISIVHELNIPVKFIGVGEKMYDLRPFQSRDFVEALFGVD